MALLKDSEQVANIQLIHSEIWTKLQDQDELYAKTFLTYCLKMHDKKQVKYSLIESIKHYMKSRMMWISILVGLVSVPTFWAAIIWVSLILE
ncbi:hypothetical protein CF651_05240 [Paenibacillus rigui]|uniref:Uncharacterized protein n=1 Tax=Paenibacillus rigui TaxID=554312 RepID=A0A229UVR1_9BACL|nr:hypothetical protein CF651_05240 [Paenibacillus rigui]